MSNWKSALLEDVTARWFRGSTPSRSHPEYYSEGEGIPCLKGQHFIHYGGNKKAGNTT